MKKAKRRISSLGEFGWLKKLLPQLYWPSSTRSQLCIGPGDDAGVLRLRANKVLVGTTDAMVEGIHFKRQWFPWGDLGHKVMAMNLSDLAAMGEVKPLAALITLGIPGDTPVDNVDKFHQGLDNLARRWKIGLWGGDTVGSKRDWFVSVTVLGEANPKHLIRRSGARVDDLLVTTGPLGLAGAGLEVLQKGKRSWAWTRPLVQAFSRPEPKFQAGAILGRHQLATSLMDSSDGLAASVRLLAEASGVGIQVDMNRVLGTPALARWAAYVGRSVDTYLLYGGEEYELIFTVSPRQWPAVHRALPQARAIGTVVPRVRGCTAVRGRITKNLQGYGYAHFS